MAVVPGVYKYEFTVNEDGRQILIEIRATHRKDAEKRALSAVGMENAARDVGLKLHTVIQI